MNWLKQIYNHLFGTISSSRLVRPAPTRWARPSIEWLEGREVPATFNVNVTTPTGEVNSCVQLLNDTSADNQANDSTYDAGDLDVDGLDQVEALNTLFAENTALLGTDVYEYVMSQGPNRVGVDFLQVGELPVWPGSRPAPGQAGCGVAQADAGARARKRGAEGLR
jgi:hypothetical protein